MMATTFVSMMKDIGSVRVSHKQVCYVFDDYAMSKIKAHFCRFPGKKCTGMKVKASISEHKGCFR